MNTSVTHEVELFQVLIPMKLYQQLKVISVNLPSLTYHNCSSLDTAVLRLINQVRVAHRERVEHCEQLNFDEVHFLRPMNAVSISGNGLKKREQQCPE